MEGVRGVTLANPTGAGRPAVGFWGGGGPPSSDGNGHLLGRPLGAGASSASASYGPFSAARSRFSLRGRACVRAFLRLCFTVI